MLFCWSYLFFFSYITSWNISFDGESRNDIGIYQDLFTTTTTISVLLHLHFHHCFYHPNCHWYSIINMSTGICLATAYLGIYVIPLSSTISLSFLNFTFLQILLYTLIYHTLMLSIGIAEGSSSLLLLLLSSLHRFMGL